MHIITHSEINHSLNSKKEIIKKQLKLLRLIFLIKIEQLIKITEF